MYADVVANKVIAKTTPHHPGWSSTLLNLLSNGKMTLRDLQKIMCMLRTIQNRLLWGRLWSYKSEKKIIIMQQKEAKSSQAKDHKDWSIKDWSKVIEYGYRPGDAYEPQYHPMWNLVEDLWWTGAALVKLE